MEFIKKIDFKTWVIIILGIALCISFWFGQKSKINTHEDEINDLHKVNKTLLIKNDSLKKENSKIDFLLNNINKKLETNELMLSSTQTELQRLKNKQNEIPTYVKHLSADDVANVFSNYLSKSPNTH